MTDVVRDTREYLEAHLDASDVSPLGLRVAGILDDIFGLHNVRLASTLRTADWKSATMIRLGLSRGLATYDGDYLTQLVVRCHDACVRLEVLPLNSRQVRLIFSARDRVGHKHERHPTLEESITRIRRSTYYGVETASQPVQG
jgi:hypothetical protein